jgi:dTDP-4-dehydrorhamnose reductase
VYGESKLAGEMSVRDECARHVIIRTSWVYSHEGTNFVRAILNAGAERDELRVVDDQHGSPTSACDLAGALLCVAEGVVARPAAAGTFHFCNSGITTWYEFAKAIFEMRGGNAPRITPISTSEFPAPAQRPAWSVLDTTSFEQVFGMTPRPWRHALRDTLGKIS